MESLRVVSSLNRKECEDLSPPLSRRFASIPPGQCACEPHGSESATATESLPPASGQPGNGRTRSSLGPSRSSCPEQKGGSPTDAGAANRGPCGVPRAPFLPATE